MIFDLRFSIDVWGWLVAKIRPWGVSFLPLLFVIFAFTACNRPVVMPINNPKVKVLEVKVMEREQNEFDLLPPELGSNLDLTSIRLLDSRNSRHYWAAYNTDGDLCLVVGFNIGRPDWSAGRNCDKERQFDLHGIGVVVKGANHFTSVIFVPDGYPHSLVEAFPGQFVSENLIAFDSLAGLNGSIGDQSLIIVQSDVGDKPEIELQILR